MKINFSRHSIELSSAEMNEAMNYGSEAYKALHDARRDYPNFKVVEIKKRSKNDFSDLDMKAIRSYVKKHGTDEQKAKFAFISKRSIGEDGEYCEPLPFFQIKSWFLAEFPEIKDARKAYREKVQKILEEAQDKVAA